MFEDVPAAVTCWSCCVLAGHSWTSCHCNSCGQAEIGPTDDDEEDLDLLTPANTTRSRTRRRNKKYTRKDHARRISSENGRHKGSAPNRLISSGIMWHPDAPCSHLQTCDQDSRREAEMMILKHLGDQRCCQHFHVGTLMIGYDSVPQSVLRISRTCNEAEAWIFWQYQAQHLGHVRDLGDVRALPLKPGWTCAYKTSFKTLYLYDYTIHIDTLLLQK